MTALKHLISFRDDPGKCCTFCSTEDPEDFVFSECDTICDDCMTILNGHFDKAFEELGEVHRNRYGDSPITLCNATFLEGLEEYVEYRVNKHNDMYRKMLRQRKE